MSTTGRPEEDINPQLNFVIHLSVRDFQELFPGSLIDQEHKALNPPKKIVIQAENLVIGGIVRPSITYHKFQKAEGWIILPNCRI